MPLVTRSGTHRELFDQADGPHLVPSTLSEMKGQANPLASHLGRFLLVTRLLWSILLNRNQSTETTLVYGRAPPRVRAFDSLRVKEQVQRIQGIRSNVWVLLLNSITRFE